MTDSSLNISRLSSWKPDETSLSITTIDAHTGGEPLRILIDGLPPIPGQTILEKRRYMKEHLDHIRKSLMWEPRGHADMYGCIITAPTTDAANFGVLFMHNEGYSTMCGHGIIAVATVALECGLVSVEGEITKIKIDSPAGLIDVAAVIKKGKVVSVSFVNVPSFAQALDQVIDVPEIGLVNYDIAYGGAFYAYVNADKLGIGMSGHDFSELIEKGMAIKNAVAKNFQLNHPFEEELNFLYGTIFTGAPHAPGIHSRNVCVFAEGEVDRSPTGTGVSGRLAIHHARGEIKIDESIIIESIVGSSFNCKVTGVTKFGNYDAVLPQVEGTAFITGKHTFIVDPRDPLREGFIFR